MIDTLVSPLERGANDDAIDSTNQEEGIQLTRQDISETAHQLARTYGGTFSSRAAALSMFSTILANNSNALQTVFFEAASIVAGEFSVLDGPLASGTGLRPFTISFLKVLSQEIFVFAAEIFIRLNAGQELPGAEGLRGNDLDSSILRFEQTRSQKLIDVRFPAGSDRRATFLGDVNGLFDGPELFLSRLGARAGHLDRRLNRARERVLNNSGFDFGSIEDRIKLGEEVFNEFR